MKKIPFFSFSLAHLSRLEQVGWGALLTVVIGFNIFANEVQVLASQSVAVPVPVIAVTPVVPAPAVEPVFPEIPDAAPRKINKYLLTSYTSRVEETDSTPFITANGSHVHMGTIAANCLAFGTKVQLPDLFGDQIFVVEDRLAARKGCYQIDVWLPEYHQAIQFGKRYSTVYVL